MAGKLDAYKLLGIETCASETAIRQAYKKQALQWHPDKNNNDPNAESMFKNIKKAYETLSDVISKNEYDATRDDNNDDDTIILDAFQLNVGKRMSEKFEEKINRWILEYPRRTFVDNSDSVLSSIVKATSAKYSQEVDMNGTLTICPICFERCYDFTTHLQSHTRNFDACLRAICKTTTLESHLETLVAEHWSWIPIDPPPSNFKGIWTSPQWSAVPRLINEFTTAIDILKGPSLQINMSEMNATAKLDRTINKLDNARILNIATNIDRMKQAIKQENQTYPTETKTSVDEDNKHRIRTGSKICIVDRPDLSLAEVTFIVQPLPSQNCTRTKCSDCSKKFMFRRRYQCRMCGESQCSDCQVMQTCRHLGYTSPVRICHPCSKSKALIVANTLVHYIQEQCRHGQNAYPYLSQHLALLAYYRSDTRHDRPLYDEISHASPSPIDIQAFSKVEHTCDEWFAFANSRRNDVSAVLTCFNIISQQFQYEEYRWINTADHYYTNGMIPMGLLASRQAKLDTKQIWIRGMSKIQNKKHRTLIAKYTTHQMHMKNRLSTWISWLTDHAGNMNELSSAALMTLYVAQLSPAEWAIVLECLAKKRAYDMIASILKSLDIQSIASQKYKDVFLNVACRLLLDKHNMLTIEQVIMRISQRTNVSIDTIVTELAVVHLFYCPHWHKMHTNFVDKKQYIEAVLCHKFREHIERLSTTALDWIDNCVIDNASFAYELKSLITHCKYDQLAISYAELELYEVSVHCYLLHLQSAPGLSTVDSIMKSVQRYCTPYFALRCQVAMYKRMESDVKCQVHLLEGIIKLLQADGKTTRILLAASMLLDNTKVGLTIELLNELSQEIDKNYDTIDAALHALHVKNVRNDSVNKLTELCHKYLLKKSYEHIKPCIYQSLSQLAERLQDVKCVTVLEELHREYFALRDMTASPVQYKAKMYLVEGVICKLKCDYIDAVDKFNQALLCYPFEEMITALTMLLSDAVFHKALIQQLLQSFKLLTKSDLGKLASKIHPPPTTFVSDNYLTGNANLNFIRKYERAITKRLSDDPLRSALSYIDMCEAVHDPTCLVSNWILACLHFYDLLVQLQSIPARAAHIYAYRNVIQELCYMSFVFARNYLPPHMQVYTFRLLLTILIETNRIFRTSINSSTRRHNIGVEELILSEHQKQVMTQMIDNIIHLTKVSPLIQMATSLSHDVLYIEAAGRHFLVDYLQTMSERNTMLFPPYLYIYYLFEGVWNGWVNTKAFDEMRFICMEALLASKGWDIIDVQLLLDIPLIPRTSDGWLHREKKALGLAGSQRFSRVDGISFDLNTGEMQFHFQTSRNRDGTDAMFSSNDVTEVFQQGIPAAFFTLNEPDKDYHAHPFHQMLYSPPALVGTQYLATLLHTDYLLKMLTTGTEICAKAPFNMRSIADSCFQRLPKHLQDKLKPLHDREHNFSLGRTHRFWIEADPLVYEQQNSTSHITFRVANVHLRVRKHLLIRNANGQLVDDDEANETEEEQRSPESQFAKAFTEHYDEIGTYFPELLRLKELLKLSALYLFARGRCSQLAVPYKLQPFVNQLVENRRSIEYPHATQANIERDYSQILSTNNVQAHGVPHTEATRVKQGIRSQLEKIDREIVEMLVSSICKQAHTNVSSLPRSLVEHWLNNQYRATENLAQFVVNGLAAFHLTLMHPITKLKICLQDIGEQSASLRHFDDTCNWVPAAFCNKLGTGVRIYGGVNLQLKLVEGNVSGNNLTQTFNAATVINSQSNGSARGKEQKEAATREWTAKVNADRKRKTASDGSGTHGFSRNSGRNFGGGDGGNGGDGGDGGDTGDDEPTSGDRGDADGVPSWYSGTKVEYYRERKQALDAQRRLKTGEFRTIDRIDTRPEIMWEVEFKDGSSLQKNGRWKHGGRPISNKEEAFLQQYGWVLPAK